MSEEPFEDELGEELEDPHTVMLALAELGEQIEVVNDPDYWIQRFLGCPEDELRELIADILSAGRAAGKHEVITKNFVNHQDWFEEARKTLGIEEQ